MLSHANQMVMNVAHSILNLGIGLLKVVVDGQLMYVTGSKDIEEDKDEVTAVTVLPTDVGSDEVIKAIDCLVLFLQNIYWFIRACFNRKK